MIVVDCLMRLCETAHGNDYAHLNDTLFFIHHQPNLIRRVEMPPDARQGYMILKHTHRLLGKKSGPQFNAYHTISWIWDKHATVQGKLIDPTRPIDRRNEKGEIVGADGKAILTARGKPSPTFTTIG